MASSDISVVTYGDGSRRESLLSILKNASPSYDNYFVTNLGKAPNATNTLHEWVTYDIARPTSVTFASEGAAASYDVLSQPVRTSNITAILNESVRVSGTERAIATATGEDPMTFNKGNALIRLKSKMEFATINGVRASGASGTARGMTGFDGMISTNITARLSGATFTETELNDIHEESWNAVGSDYVADVLACPMVIKRTVANFVTNTRNIDASAKKLIGEIQVYDSQVGKSLSILPHKDVRKAAGTVTVYALREDCFKHSFLTGREPMWEEYAKDGDRDNGQYLTELTLCSFAQQASVKRTGYKATL